MLVIQHTPLKLELYRDGVNTLTVNERNMLHYEPDSDAPQQHATHHQVDNTVDRHKGKEVVDYGEDGKWMHHTDEFLLAFD